MRKVKVISAHLYEFEYYVTWPYEVDTCMNTFVGYVLDLSHQFLFDAIRCTTIIVALIVLVEGIDFEKREHGYECCVSFCRI